MSQLLATIAGTDVYQQDDNTFSYTAGMTIDCDGSPRAYGPNDTGLDLTIEAGHEGNWWGIQTDAQGNPIVQGANDPAPGFYVSSTSLQNPAWPTCDPRRYLNAEVVPFVVCPGILAKKCKGVVLGCKVQVVNIISGDNLLAVCGDLGPSTHLGEASMRVASILGIPNSPRNGGIDEKIIRYTFYPGVAAAGFSLQPLS